VRPSGVRGDDVDEAHGGVHRRHEATPALQHAGPLHLDRDFGARLACRGERSHRRIVVLQRCRRGGFLLPGFNGGAGIARDRIVEFLDAVEPDDAEQKLIVCVQQFELRQHLVLHPPRAVGNHRGDLGDVHGAVVRRASEHKPAIGLDHLLDGADAFVCDAAVLRDDHHLAHRHQPRQYAFGRRRQLLAQRRIVIHRRPRRCGSVLGRILLQASLDERLCAIKDRGVAVGPD